MSDEPKRLWDWLKWSWLVLPLAYVCGYFVLGHNHPTAHERFYPSKSVAFAYQPLGWLEAKAARRSVELWYPDSTCCGYRSYSYEPRGQP
jgi:hypothetical protein